MLRDAKSLKREALKPDRETPAFAQGFGAAGTDVTNQNCRGSHGFRGQGSASHTAQQMGLEIVD